jgi:hypothetical protein
MLHFMAMPVLWSTCYSVLLTEAWGQGEFLWECLLVLRCVLA